jgi:MoxR-like ATPase
MNLKEHETLRDKVRLVYTEIPAQGVYYNSRGAMEFTYKGADSKVHKSYLDPMTSAVIVNALVPKSGVIFRGGHGGGKTTLVQKVAHMMTGIDETEIARAMIRGNDDQNVNTLLATLRFGKLMTTGEEEVIWRKFVQSYVKIIDEVNRFPPPAQNALFEILNKGAAEFCDEYTEIEDFMFFATENPKDPGTYPLSKPFLDRFSFCVPAPQIPTASDQYLLADRPDDKLVGITVKQVMSLDELKKAKKAISEDIKMSSDALIYSIYLTQAIASCARGDYFDKAHSEIAVGERCKNCGYNTNVAVCKMTEKGISGRAFLDFQRWGKAYSWFLNAFEDAEMPQVQLETIQTIAPYLMYHRVEPSESLLAKDPYYGRRLALLQDLVTRATQAYATVKDALKEVPKVLRGEIAPKDSAINNVDKDLVVNAHFKPLIEEADKKEFRELYDLIASNEMTAEKLAEIKRTLSLGTELRPHAQKYLLSKAIEKSRKLEGI